MKRFVVGMGSVLVATVAFLPLRASAADYRYVFDSSFSGTSPAGAAPWTDALFRDLGSTVSLTISNGGLTGSEFVSELYLNLNPALDPTKLTITATGGTAGVGAATIATGVDLFKADGDGKYDVLFTFSTSDSARFAQGDYLSYLIGYTAGSVTTLDFDFLSAPAGGVGPFLAAAHIQSIGGNGASGWVDPSVLTPVNPLPEPAAATLLLLAGGVWLARRKYLSGSGK